MRNRYNIFPDAAPTPEKELELLLSHSKQLWRFTGAGLLVTALHLIGKPIGLVLFVSSFVLCCGALIFVRRKHPRFSYYAAAAFGLAFFLYVHLDAQFIGCDAPLFRRSTRMSCSYLGSQGDVDWVLDCTPEDTPEDKEVCVLLDPRYTEPVEETGILVCRSRDDGDPDEEVAVEPEHQDHLPESETTAPGVYRARRMLLPSFLGICILLFAVSGFPTVWRSRNADYELYARSWALRMRLGRTENVPPAGYTGDLPDQPPNEPSSRALDSWASNIARHLQDPTVGVSVSDTPPADDWRASTGSSIEEGISAGDIAIDDNIDQNNKADSEVPPPPTYEEAMNEPSAPPAEQGSYPLDRKRRRSRSRSRSK